MNLIKLYGELKREQGIRIEIWEQICWHGASEEEKNDFSYRDFKIANLLDRIEERLSNKYNIKF